MVATEIAMFQSKTIKTTVLTSTGSQIGFEIHGETKVKDLKALIINHVERSSESALKESVNHRLFHAKDRRLLIEKNSLTSEGVKDADELLLIKINLSKQKSEDKNGLRGPSKKEIDEATRHLIPKNLSPLHHNAVRGLDLFQNDLRKILISMIGASLRILCLNPDIQPILKQSMSQEETNVPQVSEESIKKIIEMGFSRKAAVKALTVHCQIPEALQWLLEHPADEKELQEERDDKPNEANASKPQLKDRALSQVEMIKETLAYEDLLKSKPFMPNQQAMTLLMEMGFEESDIVDALKRSGNKESASCELLLNGHKASESTDSDSDDEIDPQGPILEAIMKNPTVQEGMNNPRSLQAFLGMLQNPASTHKWLTDSDTGPMLIQISRIYHAEKCTQKMGKLSVPASDDSAAL